MGNEATVLAIVQALIAHLEDAATYARDMDQAGYDRNRAAALSNPAISDALPAFVKKYRSLGQFRAYMQSLGGYKDRRATLHQAFEPVFEAIESAARHEEDAHPHPVVPENGEQVAAAPSQDDYDVFISHASEDKDDFARPLAEALRNRGVRVWFDEFTLKIGDSLSKRIDDGLVRSRFGVVILSRAFFAKQWTERELRALLTRETQSGRRLILPIWHSIGVADVHEQSAFLADIVAFQSSMGIDQIADQIVAIVRADVGGPLAPETSLGNSEAVIPIESLARPADRDLGDYNSPPSDVREARPAFAAVQPYIDFQFTDHKAVGGSWFVNWEAENIGAGAARNIRVFLPGLAIESISTLKKDDRHKGGVRAEDKMAFNAPNDILAVVIIEFEDIYGLAYRQYGRLQQNRAPSGAFFLFQIAALGAPYPVKTRIIPEQEPPSWSRNP